MSVLIYFVPVVVSCYVIVYYVVFRGTGFSSSVKLQGKTVIVTGTREVKYFTFLNDKVALIQHCSSERVVPCPNKSENIFTAAFMTCYTRLLYSHMEQLKRRVLYYDTDSLIYSTKPGEAALPLGSNTGIGKATAMDLAKRGARVILACRNMEKAEAAAFDIRRESGNNQVVFMHLDLASLKSVQTFAETFLKSEPRLDILVNNAGVLSPGRTDDDFGMAFGVNHLGHFLLTNLLLERMQRSGPSRVVTVSAHLHCIGNIKELANRLEGTCVTCYSLHPGVVYTEMGRNTNWWLQLLLMPFAKLFFMDPERGSQTTLYCSLQEGVEALSGRYFSNCALQEVGPRARNDTLAKQLWEFSERFISLSSQTEP